jgi:hypothetical protein
MSKSNYFSSKSVFGQLISPIARPDIHRDAIRANIYFQNKSNKITSNSSVDGYIRAIGSFFFAK